MFALCKEIISLCQKKVKKEINVMIIGLDHSGKTYFQEYFLSILQNKEVKEIYDMRTIGVNTEKIKYGEYQLCLWDIGGSESIRNIWKRYIEDAHIILYCIDSSNESRLNESFTALTDLLQLDTKDIPLLFLLTKADQLNKNVQTAVESYAQQLTKLTSIKQFSIKSNENLLDEVEEIVEWCIQYSL